MPDDTGYDTARTGWNRTIDSRPAVILEATGTRDVVAAVRVARERGVELAVQATGHGALAPVHGRLLLKTSAMHRVRVDPAQRLATVGPGATWHQVNAESTRFGLGSLAGRCGTVGVTGYTLGGGAGWLSRTWGLAADSVTSADVVLADGTLVTSDLESHPELFWALRGGSGNFGLVVSLTFRLFPAERVWGGVSYFPVERARDTLAAYRAWATQEPEGMNTAVLLMRLPHAPSVPEHLRGRQVLAIRVFTVTEEATAQRQVAPLLRAAGPPLHDGHAARPFDAASRATNGPDAPPMPHRQLFHHYNDLDDGLLDRMVEDGLGPRSPFAFVELRHWGGAIADPPPEHGPAGHHDASWSILAVAPYLDPDHASANRYLDQVDADLGGYATGGSFLNLVTDLRRTSTAFTPSNLARLRSIKRSYDPDLFFRPPHLIHPDAPGSDTPDASSSTGETR